MSSPNPKQSASPEGKFGRPVLGLLVDRIDRSYQDEVMHELAAATRARDLDLIGETLDFFAVGVFNFTSNPAAQITLDNLKIEGKQGVLN